MYRTSARKANFNRVIFRHQMGEEFRLSHLKSIIVMGEFTKHFATGVGLNRTDNLEEAHDNLMATMQKYNKTSACFSDSHGRRIRLADIEGPIPFCLAPIDDPHKHFWFNYAKNNDSSSTRSENRNFLFDSARRRYRFIFVASCWKIAQLFLGFP
jgi:hypothetical protein